MKFKIIVFLIFNFFSFCFGQIKGIVVDSKEVSLEGVSIYIENSYTGTVSNSEGKFELFFPEKEGIIVFKFLGYTTRRISYSEAIKEPFLKIILVEEELKLAEVVLNSKENPAHRVIRMAQKYRKENLEKSLNYKADFYCKGLIHLKAPEKFFGQDIGNLEGVLNDSTRTGIIYLSETKSKIFSTPKNFKEIITASKVSGNSNGYSFNNAQSSEFNFYKNIVEILGENIISPIGNGAFSFYKYRLEGTFYTKENKLINKIAVIPKQENGPVFKGKIYIVEDDWTLYGVQLTISSKQSTHFISNFLTFLTIDQKFNYDKTQTRWVKATQFLDFELGGFGFNTNGRFSNIYTNYVLEPVFKDNFFNREIFKYEKYANKKDTLFWKKTRPLPLTPEETNDYKEKRKLEEKRKDTVYLDSIDKAYNKWKWGNLLLSSKTIRNSKNNSYWVLDPLLPSYVFNPIQGHTIGTNIYFNKDFEMPKKKFNWDTELQYGFSSKTFYATTLLSYTWNYIQSPNISINMGRSFVAFNENDISTILNTITSLLFKENFAKFYDRKFIKLDFRTDVLSGIRVYTFLEYNQRTPQGNNTNFSYFNKNKEYMSNLPNNSIYDFEKHNLYRFLIGFRYRFGEKYISLPDRRINTYNYKLPIIFASFTRGVSDDVEKYNFSKIRVSVSQDILFSRKWGETYYNLQYQSFIQKQTPSFIDAFHFNGNQTYLIFDNLSRFNLMPYYKYSTYENNFALHWVHNFKNGFFSNFPIIKQLKAYVNFGVHFLHIKNQLPYREFSIGLSNLGLGKFRILKINYFRNYIGSEFQTDAIVIGLRF